MPSLTQPMKDRATATIRRLERWEAEELLGQVKHTRDICRRFTGGFWSQSLDEHVQRELGKRAGLL